MNPAKTTCIDDLRRIYARRVPKMFHDYVNSGSYSESTYRANESDFTRILFRQRMGVDAVHRSLESTMLGEAVSMPVGLAPTGMAGMQHADGEILAMRAAERAGIPFTLSTMSICSIEDVAKAASKPFWFQLYVRRDTDFSKNLLDRAKAAGCSALVLTVDLQVLGQRHQDVRNGLSVPPRPTLPNVLNMLTKPRWCLGMLGTRHRGFGNIVGHVPGVDNIWQVAKWSATQHNARVTWEDIDWFRNRWGGKFILKGILDAEDAEIAAAKGVDAIIVSNHGGRQLDGAHSSIAKLPEIAQAVGNRTEILFDGGIRSGQDVLRALALGATGTFIGRAFLYGLGAGGEAGVTRCLDIIRKEIDATMALCGLTDIRKAGPAIIAANPYARDAAPAARNPMKAAE